MKISTIFAFSCAGISLSQSVEAQEQKQINIVNIFIDDMGYGDLSCFGNKEASTPNIDRMAEEGIVFEQFLVNSPICSPSRVAISTGQYPQRWKITSYLDNSNSNKKRGIANWLDPKAPMLARILQQNGYATGHFGKWHMGGQRNVDNAPLITEYGFDESLTNFERMGAKLLPLVQTPKRKKPYKIWGGAERLGKPYNWKLRSQITGGFADAAAKFIDKAKEKNKPFYINLWPDDVHSPFFPSLKNWDNNTRKRYLAVLQEMDAQLAGILEKVRTDKQLSDNTLIVISSDNGHEPGAGTAGNLKGCKTNLYEGGIRSPLIVWGPGIINPEAVGKRNTNSVLSAIDLVPSLLSLTGTKIPESVNFDGENLSKVITGFTEESRQQPIFFSRPPDRKNYYGYKNLPDLAVRQGRWKLLCNYDGSNVQLYDIFADPQESKNLANSQIERTDTLKKSVVEWYQQVK